MGQGDNMKLCKPQGKLILLGLGVLLFFYKSHVDFYKNLRGESVPSLNQEECSLITLNGVWPKIGLLRHRVKDGYVQVLRPSLFLFSGIRNNMNI